MLCTEINLRENRFIDCAIFDAAASSIICVLLLILLSAAVFVFTKTIGYMWIRKFIFILTYVIYILWYYTVYKTYSA